MRQFTDNKNRTWELSLTIGSVSRVKAKTGVNLYEIEQGTPPLITRLGTDQILLGEIICALIDKQIETQGLTAEDVQESFDGKCIAAMVNAFYEELADFFLSLNRTDQAKAIEKQRAVIAAAVKLATIQIERIDVQAAVEKASSDMSISSPVQ